jgi:hypothetical protein
MSIENITLVEINPSGFGYARKKTDDITVDIPITISRPVGCPFLVVNFSNEAVEHRNYGFDLGKELRENLQNYLKMAFAEGIIEEAKSKMDLGYLRGCSHTIESNISRYTRPERFGRVSVHSCQFFSFEDKSP